MADLHPDPSAAALDVIHIFLHAILAKGAGRKASIGQFALVEYYG